MSKRAQKILIFFEMIFYFIGSVELFVYSQCNGTVLLFCIIFIIMNSLFRQLFLYGRETYFRYSVISMIFQIIAVSYMLIISNEAIVSLFYCTIIFEVVLVYSLYISIAITVASVTFMFIWYSVTTPIDTVIHFILIGFSSFALALLFMFVVGYLIKLQLIEKKKVIRVNKELEEAYHRLLEKASENQELSIEKERLRMAREIHDTLAHTLTALVVQMEACKKLLKVDSDRALEEIEKAQKYTREGLNDVKRTIKALRPQILENGTFFDAILNLIEDVEQNARIKILLNKDEELDIPSLMEVPLFRVIQESITNAIRHGDANQIYIDILKEDEHLLINIKDNGRGCNMVKEGFGLKGIKERIKALDGTVDCLSSFGNGFETRLRIPFKGGVHIGR